MGKETNGTRCYGIFLTAGLLLCLTGCITIERTATGDFGYEERLSNAVGEILETSQTSEAKLLNGKNVSSDEALVAFSERHFNKADELVSSHMMAIRNAIPFVTFNTYLEKREKLLEHTLALDPKLVIIAADNAFATAFPSGTVVISESLVKSFYHEENEISSGLLGIMMHELIHIRDGHAIEQWATADGRNKWVADKTLGAIADITTIIPFLSINYDIDYDVAFKSFKELPELSEYAADLAAVLLLEKNGYDERQYIHFLNQVNSLIATSGVIAKEPFSWLDGRIECLATFSSVQFDGRVSRISVGSEEDGDKIVYFIDIKDLSAIYDNLDNPAELRKYYRGAEPVSDEQLREMILDAIEKNMFTACAIQHSFADIEIKEGVLTTKGFDLGMFSNHY